MSALIQDYKILCYFLASFRYSCLLSNHYFYIGSTEFCYVKSLASFFKHIDSYVLGKTFLYWIRSTELYWLNVMSIILQVNIFVPKGQGSTKS